ncbi:hypothetical protein CL635_02320 [bacterium]|jgi:hypothetical protein|nr:hypothetical protein [bacterium]|tara:strand:- start:354 stop:761 length:408 start_codon:yes stop_codon:yes gene_type:complete
MTNELHLTAVEKAVFEALPDSLQEGWTVVDETLDSYESERQIVMRYRLADFSAYPQVAVMVERIANGESPGDVSLNDLPDGVQKELYFTMGARGVNALIQTLLPEMKSDDELAALAALSAARHKLLEINASATQK